MVDSMEIECPPNVVPAFFDVRAYDEIYRMIKFEGGPVRTEKRLLEMGYHPSFVAAVMRKMLRERGW